MRQRRLVVVMLWLLAIAATVVGFRYGLPPKEGPATATIWWFPFAFLLYWVIPGRELTGLFLVVLQFPAIAAIITLSMRKWPLKRIVLFAVGGYFVAVAICAVMVKLTGIGAR